MRQLKISDRLTQRTPNIDRYFNELGQEDRISSIEEFEIAKRAATGDQDAINELIVANLRFVISVAKQYAPTGEILSELIAQGNLGLVEAAHKFDPYRGFKFISFAVWYIRKDIMLYFNTYSRTIRVPTNVTLDKNRVTRVEGDLATRLGRDPNDDEIIEAVKDLGFPMDMKRLERMKQALQRISPLESNSTEVEWSPIDYLKSEKDGEDDIIKSDNSFIRPSLFKVLNLTERFIIKKYYGFGVEEAWSNAEIAKVLMVSKQTVTNKRKIALRKMGSRINKSKYSKEIKHELIENL